MKITLLGPAHPYRGGLAAIMHTLARIFARRGNEVAIKTFTVQYPSVLFPGKAQTLDTPAPDDLKIVRCVNTINPLNWVRVGLKIKREAPEMVILKYWTPFMAPCFGTIARIARKNKKTRIVCQIDNVAPHESHIIDRPFNRYFLRSMDGFIYMSEQVHSELREYTHAPALFSPHPLFANFGERVERTMAADRLGLDLKNRYILFFGLVRDYKGLDILIDACAQLKRKGRFEGHKLIVAGEFYTPQEPYLRQIAGLDMQDDVIMHDRFIADEDVKYYFSLSDCVVQPYKSATQSGVTQIAYQFCTPMVVTRVGGLPEIVPDGKVGYLAEPTAESVAEAISKIYEKGVLERFSLEMVEERKRFSWDSMCDRLEELYKIIETKTNR